MALSARASQLYEQRKSYAGLGRFGGATRVLTGSSVGSNKVDIIAKKNAEAELQVKIQQYNDGMLGNEEMRGYLKNMLNTPLMTATDRADIENKIRDMDRKIRVSALESAYKNAPDNSIEKIQSAQAISNYYAGEAAGAATGTPAQNDLLEKSGQWNMVVQNEKKQVDTYNRTLKRAQLFREVANQMPNTVEEAQMKAQAYAELAQQARTDGNETEAIRYETSAQNEMNQAQLYAQKNQEQADKETSRQNRVALNNYINNAVNMYKDGQMSGDDLLAYLNEADKTASELGETSVQLRLNSIATTVYRDMEKGITYGSDGAFGVKSKGGAGGGDVYYDPTTGAIYQGGGGSTSVRGGGSGTGSGMAVSSGVAATSANKVPEGGKPQTLEQYETYYQDQIKKAHDAFINGQTRNGYIFKADGMYDSKGKKVGYGYTDTLALLSQDRANDLQSIVVGLEGLNPKTKMKWNGKTISAAELHDQLSKELADTQVEARQFASGDMVPVMTTGSDGGGNTNRSVPKLKFMTKNEVMKNGDTFVQDEQGVYHPTTEDKTTRRYLTEEEAAMFKADNPYIKVTTDQVNGMKYVPGTRTVDIYDKLGNRVTYQLDANLGYIPQAVPGSSTEYSAKRYADAVKQEAQAAQKAGKTFQPKAPLSPGQLQLMVEKIGEDEAKRKAELAGMTQKQAQQDMVKREATTGAIRSQAYKGTMQPSLIDSVKDTVGNIVKPVTQPISDQINNIVSPVTTPAQQAMKVEAAKSIQPMASIPMGVSQPQSPSLVTGTAPVSVPKTPVLTAPAQPKNAIQQAASSKSIPQIKNSSLGPDQLIKQTQPQQYTWGNLANDAKKAVTNIGTKIFSLFKR